MSNYLSDIECEFCGESDPEKCPHFGEIESECECGHRFDCHLNAGEKNFCFGGGSVDGENACQCDGFKKK